MFENESDLILDEVTNSEHYIDAIEAKESFTDFEYDIHVFHSALNICPLTEHHRHDVGIYSQVVETRYLMNTYDLSSRNDERNETKKRLWGETTAHQAKPKAEPVSREPITNNKQAGPSKIITSQPRAYRDLKQKPEYDDTFSKHGYRKFNPVKAPSNISGTISLLQSAGSMSLRQHFPSKIPTLERKRTFGPLMPTKCQEKKCRPCKLSIIENTSAKQDESPHLKKPVTIVVIPKNPISPESARTSVKKVKKREIVEEVVQEVVTEPVRTISEPKEEKPAVAEPEPAPVAEEVIIKREVAKVLAAPPEALAQEQGPLEEEAEEPIEVQTEPVPVPVVEPIVMQKQIRPLATKKESLGELLKQSEKEPEENLAEVQEPSVHEEAIVEPSVHEEVIVELSIHEEETVETSIQEETVEESSIHEEALTEPSIHEETIQEPSIHEEAMVEPSIHEEAIIEHSIYEETIVESSIHEEEVIEPSIHEGAVVAESSINEETVVEFSMHEETVVEPSIHEETVVEPSIHEETVVEPSIHEEAVVEPSIHEEAVVEPPIHEETVVEPSLHEETVVEPSIHEEIVVEPSIHEETVVEPSIHEETVAEPSIHEEAVVEPSVHEEAVVEPSIHEEIVVGPSIHEAEDEVIREPSIKHEVVEESPVVEIVDKPKPKECLPCKKPCKSCISKIPRRTSQMRTKDQVDVKKLCHCCDVASNAPEAVEDKGGQWEEKEKGRIIVCKGCWKKVMEIQRKNADNAASTSRSSTANRVYENNKKRTGLSCQKRRSLTSLAEKVTHNQVSIRDCIRRKDPLKAFPSASKRGSSKSTNSNRISAKLYDSHNVAINTDPIEFTDKAQQCLDRQPICTKCKKRKRAAEKNMIASHVASDTSNSQNLPQHNFVIQTVLCQFTGNESKGWCYQKQRTSADQSDSYLRNTNSSLENYSMQSEAIQAGPSCPSKCKEAQTAFVVTDVQNGRINYVCGPDVPGIRTKIAMNLNQLPSLQDALNTNRVINVTDATRECDSHCGNTVGRTTMDAEKEGCKVLKKDKFVFITVAEVQTDAYEPNYYIILTAPTDLAENSKKKKSYTSVFRKKSREKSSESLPSTDIPPKIKESINRLKKQILSIDTLKSAELLDFLSRKPELIHSLALIENTEIQEKNISAKELKDTGCGPEVCDKIIRKSSLKEVSKKLINTGCGPETCPKTSAPTNNKKEQEEIAQLKDTGCGPDNCLERRRESTIAKTQSALKFIDTGNGPDHCLNNTQQIVDISKKKYTETACGSNNCCIDCEATVASSGLTKETKNVKCGPDNCSQTVSDVKIPHSDKKIFTSTQTKPVMIMNQLEYCEKAICTNLCEKGTNIDEVCIEEDSSYNSQFICQACQPTESLEEQYGHSSRESVNLQNEAVSTCDACTFGLSLSSFELLDKSCEASCNFEVNSNNTEMQEILCASDVDIGCSDVTDKEIPSTVREDKREDGCADGNCPEKVGRAKKKEPSDLSLIIEDDVRAESEAFIDRTKLNDTDLWALEVAMNRFDKVKPVVVEDSDN